METRSYLISRGKNPETKGLIFLSDKLARSMAARNNVEPYNMKTGETRKALKPGKERA